MKMIKVLTILLVIYFFTAVFFAYAETIYTKDGQEIQGKITEITEDTIWIETSKGDVIEETGIDKSEVVKILNDDGSVYNYSQTEEETQ